MNPLEYVRDVVDSAMRGIPDKEYGDPEPVPQVIETAAEHGPILQTAINAGRYIVSQLGSINITSI